MPYLVRFTSYAFRLLKKTTPNLQSLLIKELEIIKQAPYQAPQLSGKFSFLRSWHVYLRGVPYRIVYEVKEGGKEILVHVLAKRADVYKLLERLYK